MSQLPGRTTAFKNRGQTVDENRARRKEQTVELRKEKRDMHLAKRRHMVDPADDTNDEIFEDGDTREQQIQTLEAMIRDIFSSNEEVLSQAVMSIRKYLSTSSDSQRRIDDVLNAGVVPRLVEFLSRYNNPMVQYEAAWAMTNIASGTPEQTRVVVESGAVPPLVQLTTSHNTDICEQAVWALGNIAGDSAEYRDLVLSSGGLPPILHVLSHSTRADLVRNATWTLNNLCRGKPQPDFHKIKAALPILARLIWVEDDIDVVQDAVSALSSLSDGSERIQALIEAGVCKRLVDLLMSNSEMVVIHALRTLTNITSGAHYETQVVINAGALPNLLHLLSSSSERVRKQACFVLSNITAGTEDQLQAAINIGLIPPLLDCLQTAEFSVRKEACWAITNALTGGTEAQRLALCEMGTVPPLCGMLGCHGLDVELLKMVLESLQHVLVLGEKKAQREGTRNHYADIIEECGGLEHIEQLQQHQNTKVYHIAFDIVSKYFSAQNDHEEEMQTVDNAAPFSFVAPSAPQGGFQL